MKPRPARMCFVEPPDRLLEQELQLRFEVLRDPLGLPPEAVRFDFEDDSLHLLALDPGAGPGGEDRVVGCVLFHPDGSGGGRLYQMAVHPSHQGLGLGRRLVETLEAELGREGVRRVGLHARDQAVGFYARLGYRADGEPFTEVGIPHQHMTRELP